MKPETKFKNKVVDSFREVGAYARRIEDQYAVGLPDLILIPYALPVFICEAKIIGASYFAPSPRQDIELRRIGVSPSVIPCVMGYDEETNTAYLHKRAKRCYVKDCFKQLEGESYYNFFVRFFHKGEY